MSEVAVVVGENEEELLTKLIGRQLLALAWVPEADAEMLQFDAETAVYLRIVDDKLQIEIEAPPLQ